MTLLYNNLMEQSDDLQVLNDIGVLGGYQNQKQLLHGQVHVPYVLRLDMRALFS